MNCPWLTLPAVVASAMLPMSCDIGLFPSARLHYELAVDVKIDGVEHHGHGVYRVDFQSQGPVRVANVPQWAVGVDGEAFPIDLGSHGLIFVLMVADPSRERPFGKVRFSSADAGREALVSFFDFGVTSLPNGLEAKAKLEAFANSRTTVDLPLAALPQIVRFRDLADPLTIERVNPNDLATTVGGGAQITRVTVSINHAKVTTGIRDYLKWLPSLHGAIVKDLGLPYDSVLRTNDGAFEQGHLR